MTTLENASRSPANPVKRVAGDPPVEIPRDRWGRPKIVPADGSMPKPYTRASTLGGTLEDQTNLGEWKKRVVAYGLARRRDLILAAAAVPSWDGQEDKRRLAEIAEQAMSTAEANAAATIGTALHALTERVDAGEPIPDYVAPEERPALEAYAQLMRSFAVHGMEQFVVCDELETAGTFDRLLSPRGAMTAPDGTVITPQDRLIGDLKTSSTSDYFGIKFAVQLAVYANGTLYDHEKGRQGWPDGRAPRTDWGLIMHVPSGGSSAQPYWVDLTNGWRLAKLAVQVRTWRKNKGLVAPAIAPVDLDSLIATAGSREELTELWRRFTASWTDEHTAAVQARLAQLAVAS